MGQQWIQLVQPNALLPTVTKRPVAQIAIDNGIGVRTAEQRQHRQVGLAVATVRRGVDQNHAGGRPHHIAAPQIAVQTYRRVLIIEASGLAVRYHRINGAAGFGAEPIRGACGHRRQSLAGVEHPPGVIFSQRHRKWMVQWSEEPIAIPPGGPSAERVRARIVRARQPAAEFVCGGALGPHGVRVGPT